MHGCTSRRILWSHFGKMTKKYKCLRWSAKHGLSTAIRRMWCRQSFCRSLPICDATLTQTISVTKLGYQNHYSHTDVSEWKPVNHFSKSEVCPISAVFKRTWNIGNKLRYSQPVFQYHRTSNPHAMFLSVHRVHHDEKYTMHSSSIAVRYVGSIIVDA